MRRLLIVALAISCLAGCSKKEEPAAVAPADNTASAVEAVKAEDKVEAPAKADEPELPPLTVEEYEAAMLKLANCPMDDRGIDRNCADWKAFDGLRKVRARDLRQQGNVLPNLGRRHLNHESPAVRFHAAGLMNKLSGLDEEGQKSILDALKAEKDPRVIRTLIRIVGSRIQQNPEVVTALMALAGHENEEVRIAVNDAFSSTWAIGTEGTLEKVMEAVEKDPSNRVRELACKRLGTRADERVLPLLEKMIANPGEDKNANKLYAACVNGLIAMWSAPVPPKTPSQKAYDMTMKLLKQTPRNDTTPPWSSMSNLAWVGRPGYAELAPWFKQDDLKAVLIQIVSDRQAHWMARTGAVSALKRLGVEKELFVQLAAGYDDVKDKPGVDKNVLTALTKAQSDEVLEPDPRKRHHRPHGEGHRLPLDMQKSADAPVPPPPADAPVPPPPAGN